MRYPSSSIVLGLMATFALSACTQSKETDNPYKHVQVALCNKQVVLLGEGASHGEGTTFAFKAKIAQSLIEECGFSLILFESSFYESIKVSGQISKGNTATVQDIKSAIGPLWSDEVELQSFITFIHQAANNRLLKLGGIDDRFGSRGQDYTNFEMPVLITDSLNVERREFCREALHQRMMYSFPETDPYTEEKKQTLLSCLTEAEESDFQDKENESLSVMRRSLNRSFYRDLKGTNESFTGRAESMYKNFEYLFDGSGNRPKTIIWSSTVHAAKTGEVLDVFDGEANFGEYVKTRFGDAAYALGFSALEGAHYKIGGRIETLPKAPENSIEAITMTAIDYEFAFVETKELESFATSPAAAIQNRYEKKEWSSLLDGMIIFREQKVPMTKISK